MTDNQISEPPGSGTGPRTGSDPYNVSQEIAVLRAEVRAIEAGTKQRVVDHERRLTDRWANHAREHQMIQQAVDKAEQSMSVKLEGMNELRAQINTERGAFLTRAAYDAAHEELRTRTASNGEAIIKLIAELSALREDVSALRSGQEWLVRVVVGAVLTGIVGVLFTLLRTSG